MTPQDDSGRTGQSLLHYQILEKLGEGGMGVVYLAEDTKLKRRVAIKFLPKNISADSEERKRFENEAQAAAALNHPNIATIHAIEESDGQLFIVMEFIEGTTLRDSKQVLSEKKILDIAAQVADGLGAAHEKGIVHRDIKPENIMIRKDGIVQIMDFGLAKLYTGSNLSRLTKAGSTVGTMGYMSPEQVQGLDIDHRTDIFSLGVVLYEMLAGESPFKGQHETAIMYEIVNVNPAPIATVKEGINPELDHIVLECLEKDKDERFQSAKELARSLRKLWRGSTASRMSRTYTTSTKAFAPPSGIAPAAEIAPKSLFGGMFHNPKIAWAATGLLVIAVALLLVFSVFNKTAVEAQEIKAMVMLPRGVRNDNSVGSNLTISPDGKYISFVASDSSGATLLWVRPVNSTASRSLCVALDDAYPFWAPDSKTIAYFDKGKLMKVSLDAGTSLPICDISNGRGGAWNAGGTIVLAPNSTGGLFKVPASGGKPEEIIKADTASKTLSLRWPCFLPDGDHFLYSSQNSASGSSASDCIYVSSVSDPKSEKLISASSNCRYANGYLLFVRQSILLAQKFDPGTLKLEGEAMPIAENLEYYDTRISATFAASATGELVYLLAGQGSERTVLMDNTGMEIKKLFDFKPYFGANFSPDGNKIAYDAYDPGDKNVDVWTYDLTRNVSTRLTFKKDADVKPAWTPDGTRITYATNPENGIFDAYIKNADGSGDATLLFKSGYSKVVVDVSSDGNYYLYQGASYASSTSAWDLFVLPKGADQKPVTIAATNFNEMSGTFSPNMKWIAYQSDESGKAQVYVVPFNPRAEAGGAGGKWQISVDGGQQPQWIANGKKVAFVTSDDRVLAVDLNETSSISPGQPVEIFKPAAGSTIVQIYAMDRTGTKFVVAVPNGLNIQPPITLVANWQQELEAKK